MISTSVAFTAMASPLAANITVTICLAAVDDQGAPDDEGARRIRAQPDDAAAIFSGLPICPTGSSAITFARPSGVPPVKRTHHRGVDVAGTDGVDADVLRGVVEGRRPGEADHTVLRSRYAPPLMPMTPAPEEVFIDRPAALLEDWVRSRRVSCTGRRRGG